MAEQVRSGADAIVAPTYRTSREILAGYGESRRAREWTGAAVRLAREACEEAGREVLVCGSLGPEAGDFEAHAGIMAEAGVDVLLVEQMGSVAAARTATFAAAATGTAVWSGARLESGEWLGEWADAVEPAAPERLLIYADAGSALAALEELGRLTDRPLGACLTGAAPTEQVEALLERGATVVGLASGATDETLRPLREAIDTHLKHFAEAEAEWLSDWQGLLERAASWAPGGDALWLGEPPDGDLPAGFAWTVAAVAEAPRLPASRYRLLVVAPSEPGVEYAELPQLLESGGVLLAPFDAAWLASDGIRVLDRTADGKLAILRRG